MSKRFPPGIGITVDTPLLFNPYQQEFLKARRMRFCEACKIIGYCGSDGIFRCQKCVTTQPNAKRVYKRLGLFAGRRSGKSIAGAWAAREEMLVPNSLGWVMGPTYKVLNDATMPTLLGLIPRDWCADWNAEDKDLVLVNGAKVSFRSLDDPDRAHAGVGPHWGWMDEAAFIAEKAWDFFRPALTDHSGVCFFTSSVDGYDWTYDRIEKPALIDKRPGFWAAKYRTIDNPWIMSRHPEEIEEARATMTPQMFRQEYEGERENFEGTVYGEWIDESWLADDNAIRQFIPEWPQVDPARRVLVGLDSGSDHPFGAVSLVVTENGIVAIGEYLERQRAYSTHLASIKQQWMGKLGNNCLWTANLNEAQLRTEFAQHGVLVAKAENDQEAGRQRVLSWLYTKQLKIAHTCPRTYEQMKKLHYAVNTLADGQKRDREKIFKKYDELPDCIRYALMTYPTLPKAIGPVSGRDLRQLSPTTRGEIERMARCSAAPDPRDLSPINDGYPVNDFFGGVADAMFEGRF